MQSLSSLTSLRSKRTRPGLFTRLKHSQPSHPSRMRMTLRCCFEFLHSVLAPFNESGTREVEAPASYEKLSPIYLRRSGGALLSIAMQAGADLAGHVSKSERRGPGNFALVSTEGASIGLQVAMSASSQDPQCQSVVNVRASQPRACHLSIQSLRNVLPG